MGGFTQIGEHRKALQKAIAGTKSGVEDVSGSIGTGGKEAFRRGRGTIKRIAVKVDERQHEEILDFCYKIVCVRHGQIAKKRVYFN